MSLKKLFLSFPNQDWNYNDTAITSFMRNIAHASTKQNYIVLIRINLPTLSSKLLLRDYKTLKIMRILCQQSREETRWTKRYIKICYILWLMRNYLKVQNQLKYRRCQPWLSTSLQLFTFSSKSSDMLTKQLQFLHMNIANMNSETSPIDCWFDFARKYSFFDRYLLTWGQTVGKSPVYIRV